MSENKINVQLDLMKVKGARYMSVKLPASENPVNCLVIPVSETSNGTSRMYDSGIRVPKTWKDKAGKSHLSINLSIQLERYGDAFYQNQSVRERYQNRQIPSHSVRIILPKEIREQRVDNAMRYYELNESVRPDGWEQLSYDDKRKTCTYELNRILQIANAYFEKDEILQPQMTAQASAAIVPDFPPMDPADPFSQVPGSFGDLPF